MLISFVIYAGTPLHAFTSYGRTVTASAIFLKPSATPENVYFSKSSIASLTSLNISTESAMQVSISSILAYIRTPSKNPRVKSPISFAIYLASSTSAYLL